MSFKKTMQKYNLSYLVANLFSNNRFNKIAKRKCEIGKYVSLKKCLVTIDFECSRISIGDHSVLHHVKIVIMGKNNHIRIANNVEITDSEIVVSGNNCLVDIGSNCTIHETRLYCGDKGNKLVVGNDCLIGFKTKIMTYDAHSIFNVRGERINQPRDIFIGNHVWLSSNSTILGGATIDDNCVGGANCFLKNKTIPSGSVFVDNARIVKTDINWER